MLSRINGEYIFIFLTGIGIGFILTVLFNEKTIDTKHPKIKYDLFVSKHLNKVNISTNRLKEVKKIRILCFLNTRPANHLNKAVHIRNTWHKHCDKLLFASTLTDVNLNALGFNVTDDHSHLWGKVKLMFEFIHNNFLNEYDWFFKGDDDTFLIPENLKFLLAAYSPEDPIYFGYFKIFFSSIHHEFIALSLSFVAILDINSIHHSINGDILAVAQVMFLVEKQFIFSLNNYLPINHYVQLNQMIELKIWIFLAALKKLMFIQAMNEIY